MSDTNQKVYWRGFEELTNDLEFVKRAESEFNLPDEKEKESFADRRDFLKAMGFGVAAVSLAACEAPVKHAIPLLNKPEEYDPGIANYYASTFYEGGDYCAILVKTREGRPIKIEGNKESSITKGGTSVRTQASVLGLYDNNRFQGPLKGGKATTWEQLDSAVKQALESAKSEGKTIYIVSNTNISPSSLAVISEFANTYGNVKHIQYDPNSNSGLLAAAKEVSGTWCLPSYDFSKANTVVTIGADFLGSWLSSTEYARQFAQTRRVGPNNKKMSRLFAFESLMSITGANADYRSSFKPTEHAAVAVTLYNEVAGLLNQPTIGGVAAPKNVKFIKQAAQELVQNKGAGLVVDGSNDKDIQKIILHLNHLLGNFGQTISFALPSYIKKGNDAEMLAFLEALKSGSAGAVLFMNCNPVYDFAKGSEIASSLGKVGLSLSFSYAPDETASKCNWVAPNHYFLESWGDAEPKKGFYSLIQPAITPIYKTRQAEESLLSWSGKDSNYYEFVKNYWKNSLFPRQKFGYASFKDFWNFSLHDGLFEEFGTNPRSESANPNILPSEPALTFNLTDSSSSLAQKAQPSKGLDLVIYEKVGMGIGSQLNNPWLLEFPDPVTRACWENYVVISPAKARELGIKVNEGKTTSVTLKIGGSTLEAPALVQPGLHPEALGIAMGFGRTETGKSGKNVGINAFPFISASGESVSFVQPNVSIALGGKDHLVAHVQTHHTVMGRPVIQETTLEKYAKNPKDGRYFPKISTPNGEEPAADFSLWFNDAIEKAPNEMAVGPNKRPNHQWSMVVDLNTCFGCGACLVACNAENNVPVVGKQEVLNRREMHWIRIDRYYSSDMSKESAQKTGVGTLDMYAQMEVPSDDPEVVFQPMMCQHCNNAPCETVCPVAATTHSTEGLNQMTYNRCIGTRYCANNCPYKVRRFNWFSYPENSEFDYNVNNNLGKMVLNPDVTVRARGVMEKCSMCVQRIQEGKLFAKKEGRRPADGEINTACAQACPTNAIVFGDMGDKNSKLYQMLSEHKDGRAYTLLEEINTKPSVVYLTKVRNKA